MKVKQYLLLLVFIFLAHHLLSQAPSIVSFTPSQGIIGATVTLTGTNFSTTPGNNIVRFGAVNVVVTSATATQLEVTVPTGATYELITVTVNGLTASSALPFVVTFNGNLEINESFFSTAVDFGTVTSPSDVGISDFDGDGKLDLAATNALGNSLSVFKNVGSPGTITSATLNPKIDFGTEYGHRGLALADINGDGKPELIAVYNGSSVVVFKNVSTSGVIDATSFTSAFAFLVGFGIGLTDVAVGDLDGDGKPDLAVTDQISNRVLIFKNTSTPGIIDAQSFAVNVDFTTGSVPAGPQPMGVQIADLDGDRKPEIIVTNTHNGNIPTNTISFGNTVSVFKNTSLAGTIDANSFAPKVDFTTSSGPLGLAIGDLDTDGKPDLVVTDYYANKVSILKNTIAGGVINANSFAPKVDFSTETGPQSVAMCDLNGDGKVDLVIANFSANVTDATANTVSVLRNTTTPGVITSESFAPKVNFKAGTNPASVAIGDIDGDGKPDLAVANYNSNSISLLRRKDDQTITGFAAIPDKNMGDAPFTVSAAASSSLEVQFTTLSDKATLAGNQITIVKPGKVTITAEQPGNNSIGAAPKVSQTFCIIPVKPTLEVDITDPTSPKLTSSSSIGNEWYLDEAKIADASGQIYTVKAQGVYSVKVVVDGCAGPMSESESFLITGDEAGVPLSKAQLYPNPVQDAFTLQLSGFKESADVNVLLVDQIGRTMTRQIGRGGETLGVDVRHYADGTYSILMMQGTVTQHARFIKTQSH